MLVWMDLEMTGLDPPRDVIVEIATLITDDDLQTFAEGPDLVVHQSEERLRRHGRRRGRHAHPSGLLDAIRASTITLEEAGEATLAFIKEHVPEPRTVPLCGNSIGTDRRFLAAYLPEIENYLHYRSVDVSSVKELVRRWYPTVPAQRPARSAAIGALDDIRRAWPSCATTASASSAAGPAVGRRGRDQRGGRVATGRPLPTAPAAGGG